MGIVGALSEMSANDPVPRPHVSAWTVPMRNCRTSCLCCCVLMGLLGSGLTSCEEATKQKAHRVKIEELLGSTSADKLDSQKILVEACLKFARHGVVAAPSCDSKGRYLAVFFSDELEQSHGADVDSVLNSDINEGGPAVVTLCGVYGERDANGMQSKWIDVEGFSRDGERWVGDACT